MFNTIMNCNKITPCPPLIVTNAPPPQHSTDIPSVSSSTEEEEVGEEYRSSIIEREGQHSVHLVTTDNLFTIDRRLLLFYLIHGNAINITANREKKKKNNVTLYLLYLIQ